MVAKRRRISKEERATRDELMRCVEMSHIIVLRRMFEAGWTEEEIGEVYRQSFADCAEMFLSKGAGDPEDVAGIVFCHYEKERE